MTPLRIVHAIPYFDPTRRFSGSIAQLRRICRGLADRGHDVRVVTSDLAIGPDIPRDRWVDHDGYRVWYGRVGPTAHVAPHRMPHVSKALDDALSDADVLHLTLSFNHLNVTARKAAARRGIPYVYSPRLGLDPMRLREKQLSKTAFLKMFERRIIRDAAAIQVLTEVECRHAVRQGARPQQCVVIPDAGELGPDTEWPSGRHFRRHIGLPTDSRIVLFRGRMHRQRGLDLLLDAFAQVHRAGCQSTHLVVVGPDEGSRSAVMRRARKRRVKNAVHLVGRLDGHLQLAAYRAADVFALTARSEVASNEILEACAAGTPVLITDRCNLPEIESSAAGRVVPPRTAPIAMALWEMLGDPAELRLLGANGRRLVERRFSLSVVLDELEGLYARLACQQDQLQAPQTTETNSPWDLIKRSEPKST
jgi:glycosyltransferase involved in cell wall biosynthesis